MTDNEILEAWNFTKMVAINIGSVTLSKKDVLAVDDFINRQRAEISVKRKLLKKAGAEIERLTYYNENLLSANADILGRHEDSIKEARAEAIKEFADEIKRHIEFYVVIEKGEEEVLNAIDNLVKEFTEGQT